MRKALSDILRPLFDWRGARISLLLNIEIDAPNDVIFSVLVTIVAAAAMLLVIVGR